MLACAILLEKIARLCRKQSAAALLFYLWVKALWKAV
jgi:hypothetical protein